jgi:hypothetical protein
MSSVWSICNAQVWRFAPSVRLDEHDPRAAVVEFDE